MMDTSCSGAASVGTIGAGLILAARVRDDCRATSA